ncbi:MBL fold metallo-hydrolase [Paenibacillus sediminis]|uniref:L-ascorbate metabolism protein UlaG (Beta-lactamase superfamily) n=1 Tax=Paenibacillus sediminis TaxID=664909 RepID=A0ABS4H170_9BACL|nr:MBL fold metallo-hydrolase [Paenibacillus sediminis]MBP1936216.1 L-ascorbate metabolism protein UlaG (beta-lactamase superfamily) [Paenibacillus sediminis]
MNIQLVRHATLLISYNGKKIVVDPMLSPQGAMATVAGAANSYPNPTVNLTIDISELLRADAVLLTHSHRDHFDAVAATLLPKDILFYCQPEDELLVRSHGFHRVEPVTQSVKFENIQIIRTSGQHGSGELGQKMGPVSGFILQSAHEPTLYIAGDTIWCTEVKDAVSEYKPDVIVVFAGAAQFLEGGPITMTPEHIKKVCKHSADSKVIAAHMESWSHCLLTRQELLTFISANNLQERVIVPADGEVIHF